MPPHDDESRLTDILDAAHRIRRFVEGMTTDQFMSDERTQYAVLHCIIIIGEAATHISDETRERLSSIPWRQVRGMRNRLAHEYFAVNWKIVWSVVQNDIDPLIKVVAPHLGELPFGNLACPRKTDPV